MGPEDKANEPEEYLVIQQISDKLVDFRVRRVFAISAANAVERAAANGNVLSNRILYVVPVSKTTQMMRRLVTELVFV